MAELAAIEVALFLRRVQVFRFCSAEQTMRLAAIARERRLGADEVVFRPGDPSAELFCVVEGAVRLTAPDGSAEEIGPPGTFGVEDILSGRLRGVTATAEEETLVLTMEADDFFDLLADNVEIVKALFRRLLAPATPASGEGG